MTETELLTKHCSDLKEELIKVKQENVRLNSRYNRLKKMFMDVKAFLYRPEDGSIADTVEEALKDK